MTKNVGGIDRILRIIAGLVLIALGICYWHSRYVGLAGYCSAGHRGHGLVPTVFDPGFQHLLGQEPVLKPACVFVAAQGIGA